MTLVNVVGFLGAAVALVACTTTSDDTGAESTEDSAVAPAPLVGTYWRLIEVAGEDGMTAADPELRAHIMLHDRNRLGGSAGCNRLLGEYELSDDELAFGPIATTKMACPAAMMQQEQMLLDALAAMTGYTIDGEVLTLTGADGDLARFERYLE